MREAEIRISPDGSVVELEGKTFQGTECTNFFEPIQKALGEVIKKKTLDAYFQGPKQGIKI